MTSPDWLAAFPIQPASAAVEALQDAWRELARQPLPDFSPQSKEPALTKRLKMYVQAFTAREHGLLGMWATEDAFGDIDRQTAKIIEERRTDIIYGWNDSSRDLKLVFEFKRIGRQKRHRDHYLGEKGLGRFVTGIYSRDQEVAAMVGILLDPEPDVVPPIRTALSNAAVASPLKLRPSPAGLPYTQPSILFGTADFDTEHDRDPSVASHGRIRVSHFFFVFGYPTTTRKAKQAPARKNGNP